MIEMRQLKSVVIFLQSILSFVLPRKIIKIYNDITQKHGNVTVQDFWKCEKLKYKHNKLKLDIDFLNNCEQLVCIRNCLSLNFQMCQIKMFYRYIKDSFAAPSVNAIENLNMSQKNSVNLEPFYPNSYLLLTSTSVTDL